MQLLVKPLILEELQDEVKVGGIWGYVDSISLANTKIKGFAGQTTVFV
ncbi:hypothetical protein [Anabaena sp. PCC 7108]|nr:hypothetical protein [Anabaena sp. PCC 7108]